MFTERYIKVPIEVISTREANVMGEFNCERISVKGRINPFEISLYREEIEIDGLERRTAVALKSGIEIQVLIPLEEFEALLNSTKHT